MASDPSSREARRKRIVDRGTDRLALITGRIQTLPDAPPTPIPTPPSSVTPRPQSSQSPDADRAIHPPRPLVEPIPERNEKVDKVEEPPLINPDFSNEDAQINKNHAAAAGVESRASEPEPNNPSSENVLSESGGRPQSSSVRLVSQPQTWKHMLPFTPKQISSSVSESKSLRNFCSFIVASMVVLSYAGLPILRSTLIKKVVFFRPLLLLLLTNITIVVVPLLGEQQQGGAERRVKESDEAVEGSGMAEHLGDALEIGLLVQKVVGALFMDCSIYFVTLIIGLSLFH